MADPLPTAAAIERAAAAIDPVFTGTPQFELESLNDRLGLRLMLKIETINPIRSFKGRGTGFFVAELDDPSRPLVCASAGNFGQGLAWACRARGIALTVFAAESANAFKLERMRALGAEVHLAGRDFDAAKDAARGYAAERGGRYVEDGHDPRIAEGAGTIGLELSRDPEPFDALLVPVGNGALVSGIGTWFRKASPATEIVGVVAEGAPAMQLSWQRNEVVETDMADTIADGIAVRVPVPAALAAMRHVVDDVVRVSDARIVEAMRLAHERVGVVLEPAGAAGLAAALEHGARFAGRRLATPLCGGNLTAEQVRRWLQMAG